MKVPFHEYDWLLFDLDNTLLDFNSASKIAFARILQHNQIEFSEHLYDVYHQINSKYWHYYEKKKIDTSTLRFGRFDEFCRTAKIDCDANELADQYLNELVIASDWIEDAENALIQLNQTHRMAIITNGLQRAQRARVEKHQLNRFFEHIFISEEIGHSKPHQAYFEEVHRIIGNPLKEKVLVIGDNLQSDIKGAIQFDYHSCWFNYHKKVKTTHRANYQLTNWSGI